MIARHPLRGPGDSATPNTDAGSTTSKRKGNPGRAIERVAFAGTTTRIAPALGAGGGGPAEVAEASAKITSNLLKIPPTETRIPRGETLSAAVPGTKRMQYEIWWAVFRPGGLQLRG